MIVALLLIIIIVALIKVTPFQISSMGASYKPYCNKAEKMIKNNEGPQKISFDRNRTWA